MTTDAGSELRARHGAAKLNVDERVRLLEQSRVRLRAALMPVPQRRLASGVRDGVSGWLGTLRDMPVVASIVDAARAWWSTSPWSTVGSFAGHASDAAIRPVAQRHPVALVVAAATAGAVLMRFRPWRWISRHALLAGLLPQIASRLLAQLPPSPRGARDRAA
jgi:hypothetical protein